MKFQEWPPPLNADMQTHHKAAAIHAFIIFERAALAGCIEVAISRNAFL